MDSTTSANEQVALVAQLAQCGANLHVIVWIVSGIARQYNCWWALRRVREHTDKYHEHVVVPGSCLISEYIVTRIGEHLDASFRSGDVRVQLPVDPLLWVAEGAGGLVRRWVDGNFKLVTQTFPVSAHDDNPLDFSLDCILAASPPILARFGVIR